MTESNIQFQETNFNSLFTSHQWFSFFSEHVNHNKHNFSVALTPEHNVAFFSSEQKPSSGARVLESMTNYYSPIYGFADKPLSLSPCRASVQQKREVFSSFDYINIVPLYSEQAKTWCQAFEDIGFKGFIYKHSVNWYETDITTLESYWQRRPSKLKNTVKRKQESMQKNPSFDIRIYSQGNEKVLMQALIDYHQVYYHSWKRTEPTPGFIDCICKYLWESNELRIGIIYKNNSPIAAQIWFVQNRTAKIFKLAYNKDFNSFSPGTVLTASLIEYVICEDKITAIDFLTGNDEYKKDWMSEKRHLYGIQLCNTKKWRGSIRAIANYLSKFKPKPPI